jgi:hypothetical protein
MFIEVRYKWRAFHYSYIVANVSDKAVITIRTKTLLSNGEPFSCLLEAITQITSIFRGRLMLLEQFKFHQHGIKVGEEHI